jgi:hypothetical protein
MSSTLKVKKKKDSWSILRRPSVQVCWLSVFLFPTFLSVFYLQIPFPFEAEILILVPRKLCLWNFSFSVECFPSLCCPQCCSQAPRGFQGRNRAVRPGPWSLCWRVCPSSPTSAGIAGIAKAMPQFLLTQPWELGSAGYQK